MRSRERVDQRGSDQKNISQRNIKLAIVGFGLVGRRHATAIEHADGASLCAVAEPTDQGKVEAQAFCVPCHDDLESLIAAERPDGIILATPTNMHVEQGLKCVEAGLPVLIEKPISDDLSEAENLVGKAEAGAVPLMVGHHRRYNPLIKKAHQLIQEQRIGTIRAVTATCWFYKPDSYFESAAWRKRRGAGPVSVNLVHDIDLIRYLVGEVTQVQASAAPAARGFENEDVASALLTFSNGAIGTVTVSDSIVSPWSWEFTSKEYPIYPYTMQSTYQIGGSLGSLSIPDLRLWTHEETQDWWSPMSASFTPFAASDPLINQIEHFVSVIRDGTPPLVSGREGLRTLAVIDAIQAASRTGRTIQLNEGFGSKTMERIEIDSEARTITKPELIKPTH